MNDIEFLRENQLLLRAPDRNGVIAVDGERLGRFLSLEDGAVTAWNEWQKKLVAPARSTTGNNNLGMHRIDRFSLGGEHCVVDGARFDGWVMPCVKLRSATMRWCSFRDSYVVNVDARGQVAVLDCDFVRTDIDRVCNSKEAGYLSFRRCDFFDAALVQLDLDQFIFKACTLDGIEAHIWELSSGEFKDCVLKDEKGTAKVGRGIEFKKVDFGGCLFSRLNWNSAEWTSSVIRDCDLERVIWNKHNYEKTRFIRGSMKNSQFRGAVVDEESSIRGTKVINCDGVSRLPQEISSARLDGLAPVAF